MLLKVNNLQTTSKYNYDFQNTNFSTKCCVNQDNTADFVSFGITSPKRTLIEVTLRPTLLNIFKKMEKPYRRRIDTQQGSITIKRELGSDTIRMLKKAEGDKNLILSYKSSMAELVLTINSLTEKPETYIIESHGMLYHSTCSNSLKLLNYNKDDEKISKLIEYLQEILAEFSS